MKKLIATLLASPVLLLAACGDTTVVNNQPAAKTTAATTPATTPAASDNATATTPAATNGSTNGAASVDDPSATTPVDSSGANAQLAVPEKAWFAASSPWNQRIGASTVDARSDALLRQASQRIGVVENVNTDVPRVERRTINDGLYVNTTAWTVPVTSGGIKTTLHCRQIRCGEFTKDITLSVPADVNPDPRYDGWMTIIAGNQAYELWRGRREADGSLSYQYMRRWQLNGLGYNAPGTVAARGSGLPLIGGLIRPRELQAGEINHALAISVPGPAAKNYVSPASATDGNGEDNSLPLGARIRLKSGVRLKTRDSQGRKIKYTRQSRRIGDALVATLRQYGAIVVDRAAVPTLYGQRDVTANILDGNELSSLKLSDFEVITLPQRDDTPPKEGKS